VERAGGLILVLIVIVIIIVIIIIIIIIIIVFVLILVVAVTVTTLRRRAAGSPAARPSRPRVAVVFVEREVVIGLRVAVQVDPFKIKFLKNQDITFIGASKG
jgi:uncharacterized SAM-binding protein YcdF (DUF218 family)